jgi:parallel beta-helix repeat protein
VGSVSDAYGAGGGLFLNNVEGITVRHNSFQDNLAGAVFNSQGGGLCAWQEGPLNFDLTVDANLFLDNQASPELNPLSLGGACYADVEEGFRFTNNVVAGNAAAEAGGLWVMISSQAEVTNNTLAGNGGIGLMVQHSTPITLTNNIVVSHTVGISVSQESTATVRYTLWDGNGVDIAGPGAISQTHPVTGTPGFARPADDDYHLTVGSAAIDAGDPAGVPPAPAEDLDSVARPQGPAVDLGAYEWRGSRLYLPLVTKSFTPRTGWAIGDDETGTAVIVHTADGGLTWEVQGDSTAWTGLGGNDISAVDNRTAWAALGSGHGETGGAILHTTDGGATWVSQAIPPGLAGGMKGVKGLSRDEAWAASLGGTVLHTTDGGATWNVVPHPTVAITQVNRIDAMGTNVWIADSSDTGNVVRTPDRGLTWRAEHLPGDNPLTVHAFSPLAVWASGQKGQMNPTFYRTVDGGDQWAKISTVGGGDHLDDVCAASPDDAWGVQNGDGVSGVIWRVHVAADGTPDAKNVTPLEVHGYTPGGVTCLGTREAWVVADKGLLTAEAKPLGIIVHTTDGGETWVQQSAPTHVHYWKVSFVGARR